MNISGKTEEFYKQLQEVILSGEEKRCETLPITVEGRRNQIPQIGNLLVIPV